MGYNFWGPSYLHTLTTQVFIGTATWAGDMILGTIHMDMVTILTDMATIPMVMAVTTLMVTDITMDIGMVTTTE